MALVLQPKTAGFRWKSRYDITVDQLSKCRSICLNVKQLATDVNTIIGCLKPYQTRFDKLLA